MKRIEQRRLRLLKDHIPAWEARQLSLATEYPLAHPAMKQIRSLRKREWRQQKIGKRAYSKRVGFFYEAEGLKEKGKYQVREHIRQISQEPVIVKALRMLRIGRETPAGVVGRIKILRKAGFFPWEARLLGTMKDIDSGLRRHTFLSKPWQAMIKNHKAYMVKMLVKAEARLRKQIGRAGFNLLSNTQKKIRARRILEAMLRKAYETGRYSPWDWLKREYRPKKHPKVYQTSQRTRAKGKTDKLLKAKATTFFD